METIGWIGAMFLMLCGIPEAWKAWKEGSSGLSHGLVILWTLGEIFSLIYVSTLGAWPLIANYLANTIATGIIFRYKYWPREE